MGGLLGEKPSSPPRIAWEPRRGLKDSEDPLRLASSTLIFNQEEVQRVKGMQPG